MTPRAAHSASRSDTVLLSQQIVDYTKAQLLLTHEPYYDMVYACGHTHGLQTSCKVSLISDKLSVYKSVNDDFHVDMLIVTVVSDTWCPAKRLLFVANLCTSPSTVTISQQVSDDDFVCLCYRSVCFVY